MTGVSVANGYFTVNLDFGSGAFGGDARWLQIGVKCPPESSFTTLSPHQPLTPTPYSLYALNADYQNIVVVAKNGTSSGPIYDTITHALNSITTASDTNRFLICVAPGLYTETVTMKPYVDIEGSGELTTKITQIGSSSLNTGTVVGADNAELRFLTVENTGGLDYAVAIYNHVGSPRLTHITAITSGGGENYGVLNTSSSAAMANVTVTATASDDTINYGVYNASSTTTMTNVAAGVSGGKDSIGVYNYYSSPTMTNVSASASGAGRSNYGVWNNNSSSPMMTNVSASASGGTDNYGVYNTASSSPTMVSVSATASASPGTNSYGVYDDSSSATIHNSVIGASGGTSNYGIYNTASSGAYTVKVNNSQVTGGTNTIRNANFFSTFVGASLLAGGPVSAGGTAKCAAVYDENYVVYVGPACP